MTKWHFAEVSIYGIATRIEPGPRSEDLPGRCREGGFQGEGMEVGGLAAPPGGQASPPLTEVGKAAS